ncbi:MAG: hypothetical protein A3E85_04380 [Gammaproteobacteria bacterium RIFCSPHIGHO2_12_FULL_45_12]|nr:MAG: hypothetical protein A3E85_04380 [Gammaproteobacteria bacterium RIFCSPHIGHO2_12_FULL_45_12]
MTFHSNFVYPLKKIDKWQVSHAMVPTPILIDDVIRVFYSTRNHLGKSSIAFVDLDRTNCSRIVRYSESPVLSSGALGTFDDSGVTCDSIVDLGDAIYMYYIGWNQLVATPYRNTIGLAISDDRGVTFERYSEAPIMERTKAEPYFCTSPWVMKEGVQWHMWYSCITKWILVNDKPEALYHIKYASSEDGIHWERQDVNCILPQSEFEANVRPSVAKIDGLYRMWYCYRGSHDFRDGADSYRLGYAESKDGKQWERLDSMIASQMSLSDWDDTMQAYPAIINVDGNYLLFYNGNGFGRDGFGVANLGRL